MNFNNIFSEWKNKGNEPSSDLKNNGFQPGYKPPANIFNWFWSKVIAAITELQNKLSQTDKQSNGILTNTIYDNTSSSGYQITITVPNLSDDPFEKNNENSLDGKIIAVSMKNYTATSDNANMKLNVNTKSTDLWHYPKGKSGDTGRVHSFKAYEIRPQSVLLIAIKDHYGYVLNPPSPLKLDGKISDNTENDVDYITGKLVADYAAEFNRFVGSNAYAVDISKVNKVGYNQALCIEIPGITEWSDLNGKVIAVTTGAYCWTGKNADNKTPDKLYLRVNDSTLDDKIQNTIKRQIPSYTGVDYDTDNGHTYFTDYYMPGEIARYQTLFIGFRDTDIMLLNPPPAMRATKVITADSTDDISYVTPKLMAPIFEMGENNATAITKVEKAINKVIQNLGYLTYMVPYNTDENIDKRCDISIYSTENDVQIDVENIKPISVDYLGTHTEFTLDYYNERITDFSSFSEIIGIFVIMECDLKNKTTKITTKKFGYHNAMYGQFNVEYNEDDYILKIFLGEAILNKDDNSIGWNNRGTSTIKEPLKKGDVKIQVFKVGGGVIPLL